MEVQKEAVIFKGFFLLSVSFSLISSSGLRSGAALIPFLVRKLVLAAISGTSEIGSRKVWVA